MIKRELQKNNELKNTDWNNYLPNFKKSFFNKKTKKVEKPKLKNEKSNNFIRKEDEIQY